MEKSFQILLIHQNMTNTKVQESRSYILYITLVAIYLRRGHRSQLSLYSTMATPKSNIAAHLESQRGSLQRLSPSEALDRIKQNPGAVLIDTRPSSFRETEGILPDAIVIERSALVLFT